MRLLVFLNLMAIFTVGVRAQVPQNVPVDEAYGICQYTATETEGAQCYLMAWSGLNSARFVIEAIRDEGEVRSEDLDYHMMILNTARQVFLEAGVQREAEAAGLTPENYIATTDFLISTVDEVLQTDPELYSEARMLLFALIWQARLNIAGSQTEIPEDYAQQKADAEAKIDGLLDGIFEGALTEDEATEPAPPQDEPGDDGEPSDQEGSDGGSSGQDDPNGEASGGDDNSDQTDDEQDE